MVGHGRDPHGRRRIEPGVHTGRAHNPRRPPRWLVRDRRVRRRLDGRDRRGREPISGRVRVVRGEWCGPSGARNRGAATATGEVLAFVDSGDIPCERWLRQIVETFEDPSVGLASWPAWLVDDALDREQLHQPGPGPTVSPHSRRASRCGAASSTPSAGTTPRCAVARTPICANEPRRTASALGTASSRRSRPPRASSSAGRPRTTTEPRLDAAEHLLVRDAEQLAANRSKRVQLGAIAAVNAARCREWSRARAHAWSALRRGRSPRDLARLIVTLIPPLARRLWSADRRRARVGLL